MASPPAFHAAAPLFHAAAPLASLEIGRSARVLTVPAEHAGALSAEGVAVGDLLQVETRQPLGGPIVVRVGHARLAIAARVAREILVEPLVARASAR